MSKPIYRQLAAVTLALWTGSAGATLMPPIAVDGLEWLQPTDFKAFDWNDINSVCNATTGFCNGALGGDDLTGWTWADLNDMNGLFNYYIGAPEMGPGRSSYGETEAPAPAFALRFFADGWVKNGTLDDRHIESWGTVGVTRSLKDGIGPSLYAGLAISTDPRLRYAYAISGIYTFSFTRHGSWFFRDPGVTAVPVSATAALMGIALFFLGVGRNTRF